MKENEELKQAVEKVNTMSEDEYMQRIADLREKAILDENSIRNDGIEEGERRNKLEIAKKLLQMGVAIEIIKEATGLSEKEIKNLS